MFFLHGNGANGKTTFVETIAAIMGDYFTKTPIDTLLQKPLGTIPNDVAALRGARLVVCAEVPSSRQLSESLVKDLTGGDTISARFLHAEYFTFRPQCKFIVYGNHRPTIVDTDDGIWRRVQLIPFSHRIPSEDQNRQLPELLAQQREGILAWAIRGAVTWNRDGLDAPSEVTSATDSYRTDEDPVRQFIDDECVTEPSTEAITALLYDAYSRWCERNQERPISKKAFGQSLAQRGYERTKRDGIRIYRGIAIHSNSDPGRLDALESASYELP